MKKKILTTIILSLFIFSNILIITPTNKIVTANETEKNNVLTNAMGYISDTNNNNKISYIEYSKDIAPITNSPTIEYSFLCKWVNSYDDHGEPTTEFIQGETVYFFAKINNVEEGDVLSREYIYDGEVNRQSEWDPLESSGDIITWAWYTPKYGGNWKIKFYCNGVFLVEHNFQVLHGTPTFKNSITCDWVEGYDDHGPEKREFKFDDQIYSYTELENGWKGHEITWKWYKNNNIKHTSTYSISESWTSFCVWNIWTPNEVGEWKIKIYYEGNYLGCSPEFIVYKPLLLTKYQDWEEGVIPNEGDYKTEFNFKVHYKHPNKVEPCIKYLMIDDKIYMMEGSGSNSDYSKIIQGKDIGLGTHKYYFYFEGPYGTNKRLPEDKEWNITISINLPVVETIDATWIGSTSAKINAWIFNDGGSECEVRFTYKKEGSSKQYTEWKKPFYTNDEILTEITGLEPNKKYIFWANIKNPAGEANGKRLNFTTLNNQPPDKPTINGPEYGKPGGIYSFNCIANDNENDKVYYQFKITGKDNSGHTITDESILYGKYNSNKKITIENISISNNFASKQHIQITIRAKDKTGYSQYSDPMQMYLSKPPDKPTIDGPGNGRKRRTYEYSFKTNDPDGDQIYYYVNWGDGTNSGWKGPYDSGYELKLEHKWTKRDTFKIKVISKDIYNIESTWATQKFSTPKNNKIFNNIIFQLIQNLMKRIFRNMQL